MILLSMLGVAVLQNARAGGAGTIRYEFLDSLPVWMAQNNVPCTGVGTIEDEKITQIRVFGELQKNHPAPANTIFNVASQTKPVFALLVLRLVQAGEWNLDEPLFHYWIDPDVAKDTLYKLLTTRLVLSHQTGFPNWRINSPSKKLAFEFVPGTRFQYSGEGFEYLRKALEIKFKKPLEKLLDSIVLRPFGMKSTTYWNADVDTNRFAHWHDGSGRRYNTSEQTPVSAADDLLTTVEDYCRFGIEVMNGGGLSDSLFADMVRPQVEVKKHYYRGLGWGVVKDLPNGEYALEHGGSDIGVRTMAVFLPISKRGVVIMTNGDNGMNVLNRVISRSLDAGDDILRYMYQSPTKQAVITLSPDILGKYAGTYVQPNGRLIRVERQENALRISGDGIPTFDLYPETETKFFVTDIDAQLEFIKDEAGNVTKLVTYENGRRGMEAVRAASGRPNN